MTLVYVHFCKQVNGGQDSGVVIANQQQSQSLKNTHNGSVM